MKNTAAALVVAIKQCRDLDSGRRLHCRAAASGGLVTIGVANSLVAMYARSGSMADARSVFDAIPFKNVASWTALIHGYAANGGEFQALEIFDRMDRPPDARAFHAAVMACCKLAGRGEGFQILEKGMAIHSKAENEIGVSLMDLFLASSLIDMYSKCGSVLDSRLLFDRMREHDVVAWTGLIAAYVHNDEPELALELFDRMTTTVRPTSRTCVIVLMACARMAVDKLALSRLKGTQIHSLVARMGYESDVFVASTLVDMYAKLGRVQGAIAAFDAIEHPNDVSWNALLLGSVENGKAELAIQLFREMRQTDCPPNDRTFVSALMACSSIAAKDDGLVVEGVFVKLRSLETGMAIHVKTSKRHGDSVSQRYLSSTLVDTYSRCGSMLDARRVFDRMPQHDLVAWNALLRGYAENGEPELTLELYERMEDVGLIPDGRTFLAALAACGDLADLETGRGIHSDVRRHRAESDTFVANALIDFYGRCGSMSDAQLVFDSMEIAARNVVTWSALISGHCRQGNIVRVFDLFETMQQQRIQPDGKTLTSLLTACSHAGLAEQGQMLFQAMVSRFSVAPDVSHYNCLVDILGRAGRLDEAVKVATTMPFEANALTWKILLGACNKCGNLKLARLAFERLERFHGGVEASSFVLLANLGDEQWRSCADCS